MMVRVTGFLMLFCWGCLAYANPRWDAQAEGVEDTVLISVEEGESCPPGLEVVSQRIIAQDRQGICQLMGPWYIARIGQGGSLSGAGYQCGLKTQDVRSLGHSLCMPTRSQSVHGQHPSGRRSPPR